MPVTEHKGKRVWYPDGVQLEDVQTALEYLIEPEEIEYYAGKLVRESEEAGEVEEQAAEQTEKAQEKPSEHALADRLIERILSADDIKQALAPLVDKVAGVEALRDALRAELRQDVEWHQQLVRDLSNRKPSKVSGLVVVRNKKGLIDRVELDYEGAP